MCSNQDRALSSASFVLMLVLLLSYISFLEFSFSSPYNLLYRLLQQLSTEERIHFMPNETSKKLSLVDIPELPESVDNALKNITDEPTKNIGHTFGDVWFLVFGGISQAAEKKRLKYAHDLEIYHRELEEKIDQIPEEHYEAPSIQVTAQALENSKYCVSEEELRKTFVNLIGNSMDNRTSPFVHPSFPEMIKQMTPIEAQLISSFKNNKAQPIANFVVKLPKYQTRMLETYEFIMDDGSYSFSYKCTEIVLKNMLLIFKKACALSLLSEISLLELVFLNFYQFDKLFGFICHIAYIAIYYFEIVGG